MNLQGAQQEKDSDEAGLAVLLRALSRPGGVSHPVDGPLLVYDRGEHDSEGVTQSAGVAFIVQGALLAFVAASCLGRALVPLTVTADDSELVPVLVGGGPVLPLCGLLFLLAVIGPWARSEQALKDYEFAQSRPGLIQESRVELSRRHIRIGRTFAALWVVIGGVLLGSPLALTPRPYGRYASA